MSIEKILFPTKFRELAFDALETLFVLKEAGLREVLLLHVILREDVGFVPFGGYLKEEEERQREEARIRFEDWQKSLSEKGINSRIIIRVGDPVHEILTVAEKEQAGLIVVGRKKRIDVEDSFIGSYTHKIITRTKIPTLVSKYMVQFQWDDATLTKVNGNPFEAPLVVVDWTELSGRVVEFLSGLCGAVRKASVFYNLDADTLRGRSESEISRIKEDSLRKLQSYCGKLESCGMEAQPHLGAGDILEEILRVSRERKSSMIMIGNTCEQHFLDRMLHRSISYEVTRISELPVLLVG
ncbi:MAG: universal stress protein [Deferribacteres bacterium]|nr:universal stress protein [Deferribacteres bacterium]